ncbi:MAG: FtsH protease activity modulator HflK [Candidatus Marinimicrobia bacterium]|jgi:membrane protease subunit HflK|nr:FtsH protease activity modulator HflK [Candidatus Neomarinimicrobiota bacterium]MBT4308133.1 FtsH protease activity modulator HflK [Candidatus Neomarinimicrobiota bacterium]MBT5386699.1 FtsH protease activity modulator HflK [Candidatus Neomarinimicrobiota bacterium]MBT5777223.1 FtsH protease activity modulator HflK [Candidatus Neomarinimicrobiota bacterium]MBT5996017.1 FtsH protease activity modulator HflK [Candidatus Neomarinimicrobiota bacterium]|tara:strand:+ start:396 stop:1358 length:963 start_codon:yes stop_codon:yes gene_type:complete
MQYKRIIVGDQEIKVPSITIGALPILGIALVLWLLTGIYVVGPDEVGVVQTFGKYSRAAQSGLNYHFPYPIETVKTPKVTEVKRIEIGFRSVGKNQYQTVERESLMLTGDENIVDAEMIVQYKIKDPEAYSFNFIQPELTVREASEASLRTVVGRHNIDEALTSGKFMIQEETKALVQSILDKYKTGIIVVAVQLQDVSPPQQVIAAFKDVASAKEDKNKMVNQAEGYRNDIIPKARGEAQAMIREAEGYKKARIARAEGDVAKFSAVLKEYRKAKGVTETRMYLETIEEILPNKEKIIVPDAKSGNLINLLNLKPQGDK